MKELAQLKKYQKSAWPDFLKPLAELPQSPESLFVLGNLPEKNKETKVLTIVGSRRHSSYGARALERVFAKLGGQPIVIVSGLALGIDTLVHEMAISAGLTTVAFPGSGLNREVLYPRNNLSLAEKILKSGGALVSEFAPDFKATDWSFPKRNRLMAGVAEATLIIEAEERSGSLITARLATEYNRDVFVVPGPITSETSAGTNNLLRRGALAITKSEDILEAFNFSVQGMPERKVDLTQLSDLEKEVLDLLIEPKEKIFLLDNLSAESSEVLSALGSLEIQGLIKETEGEIWRNF